MSKSTLSALACLLLVSLTVEECHAFGYNIPPRNRLLPTMTASEVCVSEGHDAACAEVSRKICKRLTCWGPDGVVAYLGKAPNGMWCGNGYVCSYGECIETKTHEAPTKNLELVECP